MKLEYMLEDYRNGIITETVLQHRLSFLAKDEEVRQVRKNRTVTLRLREYVTGISPEEILLEQERYNEIITIFHEIRKLLTEKQFKVFWKLYILNQSQQAIAKELDITQSAVSYIALRAVRKTKKWFKDSELVSCIQPKQSMLYASTPKYKIRYPSEFLSRLCTGGRAGKRVWINHTKCETMRYLDESFGDNQTCCMYCEKCKNKAMKERVGNDRDI